MAVSTRAACDCDEESVGKETEMLGLLTAWPAATFAFNAVSKSAWLGGPVQGNT